MKKIILILGLFFMLLGCKNTNDDNLIKELEDKVSKSNNYQLIATLEIFRNEDKFVYDVISTHKNDDYFKVELTNKENNHKQIILKDSESVYVLTPSLNKSFKFQSDWPYNNSQIYLLEPIISDVKNDAESEFNKTSDEYVVISKVNYSNEKKFKKQKIYFDANKNIKKVEILDDEGNIKMKFNIVNIKYNTKLDDDFFDINRYHSENKNQEEEKSETSSLNDIVYPMYVPVETYLSGQDVIETENGERVILTFSGDSNFILIQEDYLNKTDETYVYGDPYLILDTVGAITDSSVSWISNGVEYSVISDAMSVDEMITVAQSIGVEPVSK